MLRRRNTTPSTSAAFTLVELLVVIGLIGLLLSILLPALAKARASSRQLQCATNLRSWGQAFQIYADLNHGILPHSEDEASNPFPNAYTYVATAPWNEACYTDLLPPLMARPAWSSFADGSKPTGDIWQCPLAEILSDTGNTYDYSPSIHGYHSYCMNEDLDNAAPVYPPFLNLAKCRACSVTLLMFETTLNPAQTRGQGLGLASTDCFCGCYADSGPADLGDRHPHRFGKLGGNLMMLDGHVEWTDHLYSLAFPNPDVPPKVYQTWWPY